MHIHENVARLVTLVLATTLLAALPRSASGEPSRVGLERRVPWTASKVKGSPEPPLPYVTQRVFPKLKFDRCLDLVAAPGSDRLFVVEQSGKIFSFPNQPDVSQADLVVDFAKEIAGVEQVYALAFHPDFERNRYCYVCYIKASGLEDGTHVARFRLSDASPPTIDPSSETPLLTWLSGGHNGCCLKFGPDGCLYISTGDGGPANPPDPLRAGQDLGNLLSSILRIDVDHAEAGKNYRIPKDNPFVGTAGARGEIWAYGLRNPWRMNFDQTTGDLWVGDVGWERWEMIYRVERGGNYGWAVMEGRYPVNQEWQRGPTPILPPTIDHPHTESSSITGGLTYHGDRLPELRGTYVYGDYDTGRLWGFRYDNGQVVDHRELADTTHRIVGFGEDHSGEFYLLDHTAGTIHRLVPNSIEDQSSSFPRRLSETGLFASVSEHRPMPGVLSYSINAEPWTDHAVAERFVAVPGDAAIQATDTTWTFPQDSVLVKTLSLDLTQGDAATRRRIETQILHFDGTEWNPYTYQWNDEQSDAELVEAGGAERLFEIVDAEAAGGTRLQRWRFVGRAECQRCHNKWSGPPLGFNTPQLNRVHEYAGLAAPQLDTLASIRSIENLPPEDDRPQLADPTDPSTDLEPRARAYLHANCAHCHRQHAGGAVLAKLHYDVALDQMNLLNVRPTQGTFDIYNAKVVAPGDPPSSVLLYRMAKLGAGRMPHIASSEIDLAGVELIHRWIDSMPFDAGGPGNETIAKRRNEAEAWLARLAADPREPQRVELVEQLLATPSDAMLLLNSISRGSLPKDVVATSIERAAGHEDASVRDLFERFLPPEQRVKRLGSVVDPDDILALEGEPSRGRLVFFGTAGVSCKNCHRVHDEGKQVGPDLTSIGKKLTRPQLLESILEPSKRIDPEYVTQLVETKDGRVLSGVLVARTEREIVIRDAAGNAISLDPEDVETLATRRQSLMPDLLLRDLTAQQVADLLAYLESLQSPETEAPDEH